MSLEIEESQKDNGSKPKMVSFREENPVEDTTILPPININMNNEPLLTPKGTKEKKKPNFSINNMGGNEISFKLFKNPNKLAKKVLH